MIEAVGKIIINRSPKSIIDFVSDIYSYKYADLKINKVFSSYSIENNKYIISHNGYLRGIPGPTVSLEMTVDKDNLSVLYKDIPTFPSKYFLKFNGGFELAQVPNGTQVIHTERFNFKFPIKLIAEPFLKDWLQSDINKEMFRLKHLVEDNYSI